MSDKIQIDISILGDVFVQIQTLTKELSVLKESIVRVENTSAQSFTQINKDLKKISVTSLIQQFDYVNQAFEDLTRTGIAFDSAVAELSAITGIAGKDLKELGKTAREVGKESGLGAVQATEAFKLLASQIEVDKIGIDGLKILQQETIKLAQAAKIDLPQAANAMASAINQFGLEATDASRVINILAAGSKYGAAEIDDLAESFKNSGAVANAAGIPMESLAGSLEVLSKNSIKGSEAGRMMKNIILQMQTQLGVDFKKTSMADALDALKPKLNDTQYLLKIFGRENITAAQFLIQNAQSVKEMTQKVTGTNVAYEQAKINTGTFAHQLDVLKSKFDDIKISIFDFAGGIFTQIQAFSEVTVTISRLLPLYELLKKSKMLLRKETYLSIAAMLKENALKIKDIALKGLQAVWNGIVTATQWALNIAMEANPIGLIITGVGLLIGGIVLLVRKMGWFKGVFTKIWSEIKKWFMVLVDFWNQYLNPFSWLIELIDYVFPGAKKAIYEFFGGLWDWIYNNFFQPLIDAWNWIKDALGFGEDEKKLEADIKVTKKTEVKEPETEKPVLSFDKKKTGTQTGNKKTASTGTSSGGGGIKNIQMHIDQLVGKIEVRVTNLRESQAQIKEAVSQALIAAVRDTEVAIS